MDVTLVWRARWAVRVSAVMLGLTAVAAESVLLRATMALIYGSEISIGMVLAAWLLWTALGSALGGALARRARNSRAVVAGLECAMGFALCLALCGLHLCRLAWAVTPGEMLAPEKVLLAATLSVSLFCLAAGAAFAALVRMARANAAEDAAQDAAAAGRVYLLEAAGSAIGGLLTGLVLVRLFSPMQVAALLLAANVMLALLLLVRWTGLRATAIGACGVVVAVVLVGLAAPRVEQYFRAREWPGFQVLDARESLYGSLMVTEAGGMRSIYENGVLTANAPDPETAEEAVHLALLEHPAPRRVLLVGGSATGAVSEALKHPTVERVDVVELDPELLRLVHERLKQQAAALFHDYRVKVHVGDGRRFVAASRGQFDAILVIGPDPETAALNRFYTVEFFRTARARLAPGGVFSFAVRSQEEALTPELRAFLQSMKSTLEAAFPYVVAIPGDTMHFVAAQEDGVPTDRADLLVARLKARGLQTQYVREYLLPYRMAPERMEAARIQLASDAQTRINRDFEPVAYYENAVLWSGEFRSVSARWMEAAARLPFFWALSAATMIAALLAVVGLRNVRSAALISMGSTGFTLMALQVFLLLAFQALCGYVYRELTLLVGLTMAGMAVGAWWGLRRPLERVAPVQAALACALPLLMAVAAALRFLEDTSPAGWTAQVAFPILAAAWGALGGVQFPRLSARSMRGAAGGAALLYAVDLAGGCVGALLVSLYLIPVFGFWPAAWLCAMLAAGPAVAAMRLR